MPQFSLPRATREPLWRARFGNIDTALRFAAIELELASSTARLHSATGSDGEARHFAQFLVWASSARGAINEAVRRVGNADLSRRWAALATDAEPSLFKELRDQSTHEVVNPAPWQVEITGETILMFQTLRGQPRGTPPHDAAEDYLVWIRDKALPFLFEAIELDARGTFEEVDDEFPIGDQVRFWYIDPRTANSDPEVQALARDP
jgi:hypothetical protein